MAATAFFLLMAVLFFVALFFITLNLVFIIIWSVRKRKGKAPRKRFIVIPIIFLIISLATALIPIGWVGLLRIANSSNSKDIIIAESGKIAYWGCDENDDVTAESFDMDGITYIEVQYSCSPDTWKLGEPVANVKYKSDEEGFNRFMKNLFAYDGTSTLYPVINEKGFELYTIGSGIFCPQNQKDTVLAYYNDLSNYNTQNCRYEYGVSVEATDEKAADGDTELDYIYKNVTLNQGIFEKLYQISDIQELETIKVPERYVQMRKARRPGTPAYGFNLITLYAYSKDGAMSKVVEFGLIDEQTYCIEEYEEENEVVTITGYHLTQEINEYLKNTIFRNAN